MRRTGLTHLTRSAATVVLAAAVGLSATVVVAGSAQAAPAPATTATPTPSAAPTATTTGATSTGAPSTGADPTGAAPTEATPTEAAPTGSTSTGATSTATTGTEAPADTSDQPTDTGLGYDAVRDKGSLYNIAEVTGAHASWRAGYTGRGVGVALIDTGVSPVPGLVSGNVVDGADLSFDSQSPEMAHLDAFGHGTHLASIIAGRDTAGTPSSYVDPTRFNGIAPDATLVDVKVGASDGAVDVSQVIAGINWVVEHARDPGMNIRVINLSYGTDSVQDTQVDPMTFAVENAWRNGIVVVVAGGNEGESTLTLAQPARDPFVIAVGASDTAGTVTRSDDTVPAWSTRGDSTRAVDVVAPGVSVIGARVPNGYADQAFPSSRVGSRFAHASGTSQAAAVVSGEVALLLQQYPWMTPDQVKAVVTGSANGLSAISSLRRGSGLVDISQARRLPTLGAIATSLLPRPWGRGTGSLEASRGSAHVFDGISELTGEVDVQGNRWDAAAWARATGNGTVWDGGRWRGTVWTGSSWSGQTWPTAAWAVDWNGVAWTSADWSARTWRDGSWTARTWRDSSWSARTWRSVGFSSVAWS
ncbi:S8 family serine peptidase [Klenkia brasiliensis]|uniref:Serine protease AprX n=1 Tax=Klenkia brasiliensis TaxID=333142 RepID=A0A1G7N1G4_9ACTN|nr:S8 family serine peptidase [Klenkia brasiliensis]SDF67898.1 serine protease AprX [Klenkia brasiliensis]